jgi:hypothetical protein
MFFPPLQKALDVLSIHLKFVKYHQFFIYRLFYKLMGACHHFKNIQTIVFIRLINKGTFNLK